MKKLGRTTLFLFCTLVLLGVTNRSTAQPAIDGIVDGIYGTPYKTYNNTTVAGNLYMYVGVSGDNYIYFAWKTFRSLNDNVYSDTPADVAYAGWGLPNGQGPSKHDFGDLLRSDRLYFEMYKGAGGGTKVVDVQLDYLFKRNNLYYSGLDFVGGAQQYDGVNTLGGGNIDLCKTSLEYNIWNTGLTGWSTPLTSSPPYPELNYANWQWSIVYEWRVSKAALGGSTFNKADVTNSHNSPQKNSGFPELKVTTFPSLCFNIGDVIEYTIDVKNIGFANLRGTILKVTYYPNTNFISSTPAPSSGNDTWDLGTLTPEQTKTVLLRVGTSNLPDTTTTITLKGEVTAAGNAGGTIKASFSQTDANCTPLPVQLISFTSTTVGKSVQLKWRTATEINNFGFEVQRSVNEKEWVPIAFVDGHGTVNTPQSYSYFDENIGNKGSRFSYRLKQIDRDGTVDYSPLVQAIFKIDKSQFGFIAAYPNPFNPTTVLQYYVPKTMAVTLKIYNTIGSEVSSLFEVETQNAGVHSIMFDARSLASGTYYAWLISGNSKSMYKISLTR